MNVLVIGKGGREHAIGWKISKSAKLHKLYFAPGNGGTESLGENVEINPSDHESVAILCKDKNINLVVIGADEYLAQGLTDVLISENIKVFAPTKKASRLEWSKAYAKEFMLENSIPSAAYKTFSESNEAIEYARNQKFPIVIKASGLALGKGVIIAETFNEAEQAIISMLDKKLFGNAGESIVIEEYLTGKEISVHAFCDGNNTVLFPPSQDHKRRYENDMGPNTGGMGTVAPVSSVTKREMERIKKDVVDPTIRALRKEGSPFVGILFPGIMLTSNGPKVIEFNARFGDPEAQAYLPLLKTDLLDIMIACVDGNIGDIEVEWLDKYCACVALVSDGYPGEYKTGFKINGLNENRDKTIFHAGTVKNGADVLTAGGRVLNIVSLGDTLRDAIDGAYEVVDTVDFKGKKYRKDIGYKSV